MVSFALPVLVVGAAVHLHRDLPAAKILRELAVDVPVRDAPVEVAAVRELELLGQVHLDSGAKVGLLGLGEVLIGPAPGPLSVEQLVEGVAKRPAESLAGVRLVLEPLDDVGQLGWHGLIESAANRPCRRDLSHRFGRGRVSAENVPPAPECPGARVLRRRSRLIFER